MKLVQLLMITAAITLLNAAPAVTETNATAPAAPTQKAEESQDQILARAYAKEFAFLKSQKEALKRQYEEQKARTSKELESAKQEINKLQDKLLGYDTKIQATQERLIKAQRNRDSVSDNVALIESTFTQAKSSLFPYGINISEVVTDLPKQGTELFKTATQEIDKLSGIHTHTETFFLLDGVKAEGTVIKIGDVAAYGITDRYKGVLVPAGGGKFKAWNAPESFNTADMLDKGSAPANLNIFLYENKQKEVEDRTEKTVVDVINSGGIIGWVIVGLGIIGALLMLVRAYLLATAGAKKDRITQAIAPSIVQCDISGAQEKLKSFKGSTARVLRSVLVNIEEDKEHIENVVTENILNESSNLDRFASVILVIAAVAPLLGLLGTVTGMIATFDIITQFGTGDPKLLAGGISVALVTTELGLIVAIPTLLLGNLLSGWATTIKDGMEESALHLVNVYEKNVRCKS